MADSFHRVNRSLRADSGRRSTLLLLTALLLLGVWVCWTFQARVTRYEISDSARLELDSTRPGMLRAIAEFPPSAALDNVHPGQPATVRLAGFSAARYGMFPARVSRVAGEIRDGHLSVELALNSVSARRVQFQSGLPAIVEIEIERVSPAALILRSAGALAGGH